jgi:hypothetical protein
MNVSLVDFAPKQEKQWPCQSGVEAAAKRRELPGPILVQRSGRKRQAIRMTADG